MATVNVPQWRDHRVATILRWRARDGDFVAADDPIVELEYPDAIVEVPAGVEGIVSQTHNWLGDLPIGKAVATIDEYSMPGMPTPRLKDYGLTRDVVTALQGKQKQLENFLSLPGAALGGVIGYAVLIEAIEPTPSSGLALSWILFGAFLGLIAGIAAGQSWGVWILRRSNERFSQWQKYKSDRVVFVQLIKAEWEHDRRSREEFWRSLTGHQFEQELANLFSRLGWQAERTKGSGDAGVDIHLIQGRKKIIVQCKNTKQAVGPAVARELFGTLNGCDASEGWLATTAGATNGVYEFFRGKPLRVVTLAEIVSWSMEVNRSRAKASITNK